MIAKESSMKRFLLIVTAAVLVLAISGMAKANDRNGQRFDDQRIEPDRNGFLRLVPRWFEFDRDNIRRLAPRWFEFDRDDIRRFDPWRFDHYCFLSWDTSERIDF
jgi:hypothetical protein